MEDAFATDVEPLQSCDPQISFFELIESVWSGQNDQPLHRFCSLMRKMDAKAFVKEELLLNQELEDEREMVSINLGVDVVLEAIRLTFFCNCPESGKWDDAELYEEHILGYAVVVKLKKKNNEIIKTYLLEAVVRPPSIVFEGDDGFFVQPITNYYLHNIKPFKINLGTEQSNRPFTISGSFFTQQNQITSVCAHACLRMAMNSSPLITCDKLTNRKINDILGISDYKISGGGLSQEQIKEVVRKMGYKFHSANFLKETDIEYDHLMYPSLESCFPTILGIEWWDKDKRRVTGHVVTVLGHTINSDRWEPEAERGYGSYPLKPYISTAEWCDHYIISDDNYGMYSTLPTDAIRNFIVPTKNPNRHVGMAVSIVPDKVTVVGYMAEQFSIEVAMELINNVTLQTPNKWHDRLKNRNLVCRTLLQTKSEYEKYIKGHVKNLTTDQQSLIDSLSEYIWVSEISLPNIYTANKHKLGDVVLKADVTEEQFLKGESLALAWFPGFVQIGCKRNISTDWDIETHVPLIRNAEDSLLEW